MAFFAVRSQQQSCHDCDFFLDDPIAFEKALPGICILSSGQGDTKGDQGICTFHQQLVVPRMSCKHYKSRATEPEDETAVGKFIYTGCGTEIIHR